MRRTVGVIGSGNWGTTISHLISKNIMGKREFEQTVYMWTYEELVDGRKLTEIINKESENVKYLPGIKLKNVLAVPDLIEVTELADILVFVVPHQFMEKVIGQMKGHVRKNAVGVNLTKGLIYKDGEFVLLSQMIEKELDIPCGVLMGANIAIEVAKGEIAEGTLACKDRHARRILFNTFNSPTYRLSAVDDVAGVETSGTLKNVVAIAYGIAEGMGWSCNTSVAVLRAGLNEMKSFMKRFFDADPMTLFESSGFADLLVSCIKGRNHKCGLQLAQKKSIAEVEEAMGGQKLQGTLASKEIYGFLSSKGLIDEYPLMVTVYRICYEEELCDALLACIPYTQE
ncbi:Glycerol-3-phosphate dehydrogenase NAD-dependent eukaryotic [Trinorchestia longiramus]|nr:Glycerol-3-phosphate dehydrogenase NAD-dependent eukaryotic [Trinorchestia longiramus]